MAGYQSPTLARVCPVAVTSIVIDLYELCTRKSTALGRCRDPPPAPFRPPKAGIFRFLCPLAPIVTTYATASHHAGGTWRLAGGHFARSGRTPDAGDLLATWTALWDPVLIAQTREFPAARSADAIVADARDPGELVLVPQMIARRADRRLAAGRPSGSPPP